MSTDERQYAVLLKKCSFARNPKIPVTLTPSQSRTNASLVDISLAIKRGEMVGVIGGMASGKSTLMSGRVDRLWNFVFRSQVLGRLFAPSQNIKKLSHQFWVCFELGIGILNVPRKIFLVVYEPILKLQGLVAVEFQGKNCFKKTASNFSEIDCGFR